MSSTLDLARLVRGYALPAEHVEIWNAALTRLGR